MTPSPSVTWPSPAMTTVPLRRTERTVVERIRRFVGMSAILDYNSPRGGSRGRLSPREFSRFLLQRDQRDRRHGGQDAGSFPSGELFFEKEAGQQHGQRWIERGEHHHRIQPPCLIGPNEECGAGDIQTSSEDRGGRVPAQQRPFVP